MSTDIMYSDEFHTAADLDEVQIQDSFTKVNARIELGDSAGVWSVALLGKNLTDETTITWGNDVPLGNFGFSGSYQLIVAAPRSFEIQGKYNF